MARELHLPSEYHKSTSSSSKKKKKAKPPPPPVRRAAWIFFGHDSLASVPPPQLTFCKAIAADDDLFKLMVAAIRDNAPDGPRREEAEKLLDPETERTFTADEPTSYGDRGGLPYRKPLGWVRWNVKDIDPDDECFDWAVGYHGTAPKALLTIADEGLTSPADRGVRCAHGQAGALGDKVGRTIYTSPCVGYSAHPVYTPLMLTGATTAAQVLLQVRVDQKRVYNRLKTTLGKLHWKEGVPFERGFGLDEDMEWLLADRDAVRVTGVLFRELGRDRKGNRERYGDAACSFRSRFGSSKREYEWTDHLAAVIEASE